MTEQLELHAAGNPGPGPAPADLEALGAQLDGAARAHQGADTLLSIRAGADATAFTATGPDRPFLVDSLLAVCTALGLVVRQLYHPIVMAGDARRSVVHIVLPPLSAAERDELETEARAALSDIHQATGDYLGMRRAMQEAAYHLSSLHFLDRDRRAASTRFLTWLSGEHFVFLGMREYRFRTDGEGNVVPGAPEAVAGSALGILCDPDLQVLNTSSEPAAITEGIADFLEAPQPLIIAKSTLLSRVHRRVPCDYVGIKQYDRRGNVTGELRFVGLFTSEAYDEAAHTIPLIRQRMRRVMEGSGAAPGGHSAKAIANLLETWPRDELFQTDAETLTPLILSALGLVGRPRTRVLERRDRFGRFVTVLVYVLRDAYDTALRRRITDLLERRYKGEVTDFQPRFDSTPLARVQFQIAVEPGKGRGVDLAALEAEIDRMARTWEQGFRAAVAGAGLEPELESAALCFRTAFSAGYREAFTPEEGLRDVREIAELAAGAPVRVRAYDDPEVEGFRTKIYTRNGAIALSDCVPVLENMGLFVVAETGYPVRPSKLAVEDAPATYWVHSFVLRGAAGREVDLAAAGRQFERAFVAVWEGRAVDDRFNALVLSVGAEWREAAMIRTLAAHQRQGAAPPARGAQAAALSNHPKTAAALIRLFVARFDPDAEGGSAREAAEADAYAAVETHLSDVPSLQEDRILRGLADLIRACVRTNFFQRDAGGAPHPWVSVKVDSSEAAFLPPPRPYREIFMHSPLVEGVHLRFGPVARGGIRWSDRAGDYRTEVLGLVKAQQVKNAVIVPVGSKGGFVPKQLPPRSAGREAWGEAGREAYVQYITALLGLTDNLVEGRVVHPERTVRHDGDDPYLVVAADKGTARFSDTANSVSQAHGFWLGDAFASGGSAGYDHKAMGITARGAWVAVQRHFRELGKDIQKEPFTCIGVGDMGGDVFGNGLLLSRQTRLIGAFNHLHVFLDPDPDAAASYQERKRLFEEGAGWDKYDPSALGPGGAVIERSAKSAGLSPEAAAMLGLPERGATPAEVIHALLKTRCELMWFGGIGTYVRASTETDLDVGDVQNNALRITAAELGAAVVGEGANLAMTQASRIEAARRGVKLNTDAIDNSAGVDSSDHEVNIKILLAAAIESGALAEGDRNALLASMTEEVAGLVLAHNYEQTLALTLAEATAGRDHAALGARMDALEAMGRLDRAIEGLPGAADMQVRAQEGTWLTRPELAVVLAWSKIVLFDALAGSEVVEDPVFDAVLQGYFPDALGRFDEARERHRLAPEIKATVLANRAVNAGGPAFWQRLLDGGNGDGPAMVARLEAAMALLDYHTFRAEVCGLDNQVPAAAQTALHRHGLAGLETAALWLARHAPELGTGAAVERFGPPLAEWKKLAGPLSTPFGKARIERTARSLAGDGVPEDLAQWAGAMEAFAQGLGVAALSEQTGAALEDVAWARTHVTDMLRLDRVAAAAREGLEEADSWDALAGRRMLDSLHAMRDRAARDAVAAGGAEKWLDGRRALWPDVLEAAGRTSRARDYSFAKLSLLRDAAERFVDGSGR